MEQTINDLKRWITSHYSADPSVSVMREVISNYAEPLSAALHGIQTASEWMKHDLHELIQSLRSPWKEIINPPPRSLPADKMNDRLRMAVRKTYVVWREQMQQWISEFGDDGDAFIVKEADIEALRSMTESFATLKALKSEESVRKKMDAVIEAAIARWRRKEQQRQDEIESSLAQIRVEAQNAQRQQEAIRRAARQQGLSLGRATRSREWVDHGMLARRRRED